MNDSYAPDRDFQVRLGEVRSQTAATLRNTPTAEELQVVDQQLRALLAEALVTQSREAIRNTGDALEQASLDAFRQGGGRRPTWTLTDWGHEWMGLCLLATEVHRREPGGETSKLLAFVRSNTARQDYLLAFLNKEGDPVPRRLIDIAALVGEASGGRSAKRRDDATESAANSSKARARTNTVFNRLKTLAAHRLVQRAGPCNGLYELTRWGYETARALQADDAEQAVRVFEDYGLFEFLAMFDGTAAAPCPVDGAAIREKLRSAKKVRVEVDWRVADQLLSLCLSARLVRRVGRDKDRYERTPLGNMVTREVAKLRDEPDIPVEFSTGLGTGKRRGHGFRSPTRKRRPSRRRSPLERCYESASTEQGDHDAIGKLSTQPPSEVDGVGR